MNISGWSDNKRINTAVFASGIVGSLVATPGAVLLAEGVFPHQMGWLKKIVAQHVVAPRLAFFEKLSGGLRQAHEKYDQKKREQRIREGKPVRAGGELDTPQERADIIADTLVTGAVAFAADFPATCGLQALLNRRWNIKANAFKTNATDYGVMLGAMAVLPLPGIARLSENIHYGISHLLRKIVGKERAEDIGISLTYIGIPSILGNLANLLHTRHAHRSSDPHTRG